MKKYNPVSACAKCGHKKVDTTYMPARTFFGAKDVNGSYSECMKRTCTRCGYTWDEEPLTKEEEK